MLHGYSTVAPKDFYLRLFQFISVAKNLAKSEKIWDWQHEEKSRREAPEAQAEA